MVRTCVGDSAALMYRSTLTTHTQLYASCDSDDISPRWPLLLVKKLGGGGGGAVAEPEVGQHAALPLNL